VTIVMSLMKHSEQTVAPDWVRARAAAIFMLVYMGGGRRECILGLCGGARGRTFLPGSGDWHSGVTVLI